MMNEPVNPYASPQGEIASSMQPDWLGPTRSGLSLIYYGVLVLFVMAIGLAIGGGIVHYTQNTLPQVGKPSFFTFLLMTFSCGRFFGLVLMLIGQILCISIPAKSGVKWYIIVVVILQVINILFLLWSIIYLVAADLVSYHPDPVLADLTSFLGTIVLLLFLRRLSAYIGHFDLVDKSKPVLILFLVQSISYLGLITDNLLFLICIIIAPISGLIFFIMYVNFINGLRKAIASNEPCAKKSVLFGTDIKVGGK